MTPRKTAKTMIDARGREIPVEYVPKYDRARDRVVRRIHREAVKTHERLAAFRESARGMILDFVRKAAEDHDMALGGEKGNITLRSFDGLLKVQLAVQDHLDFNEKLGMAQTLIGEYLQEISKGADPALVKIVHRAFYADQRGRLRTNAVLALRNLAIKHPKWRRAMEIIVESIVVASSKQYVRVYARPDTNSDFAMLSLDIASA